MTHRSMLVGLAPTILIRAGGAVEVHGWAGDRLEAETDSRWGLRLGQRRGTFTVEIGGDGVLRLPIGSELTVYSGRSTTLTGVSGRVTIHAGGGAFLRGAGTLLHLSAGGLADIEAEEIGAGETRLTAGSHLRCAIRQLRDTRILVSDVGGRWEGRIGHGRARLLLTAGGDVTIVSAQALEPQPPHFILGRIERPA
jgi:hypothetical protein